VNRLRSVGTRLTLALALAVAAALGVVYLIVVPSLERNLVNAKMSQLRGSLPAVAAELDPASPLLDDQLQNAAEAANARVVLYRVLSYDPPTLQVIGDSRLTQSATDVEQDPVALEALVGGSRSQRRVDRAERPFAEVARPLTGGYVILLSASLYDAFGSVQLVQRRLLLAGVLALSVVSLLGYGAATAFARRIRRLEGAAERIAGGDFGEAVEDRGRDELGQLARAFERMRGQLAQLDDARRAFIANASHELRTPLFSLGGFLELLDDEELDEPTRREFLTEAIAQVARLQKLAVDLLDLSRLDAGKLRLEHEPVDLERIAHEVVGEFALRAARREQVLAVVGEPAPALADSERVTQIARILVDNALVHTPPGTEICVHTRTWDGLVELSVEDDGPGVPPQERERVFERFARLNGAVASGSGLGLAIARELATLMDGAVGLEVVSGRTTFTLRLPVSAGEPFSRENVLAGAPLQ
jgi:two-component system, OmpR family, sensor kinase